jgi:hypothetical protein
MSSTNNELKVSLKDVKEIFDMLVQPNKEINDKLVLLKKDYTKTKIHQDNILVAYKLLSTNTH